MSLKARAKAALKAVLDDEPLKGYMGADDGVGGWIYAVPHHPGFEYVRVIHGSGKTVAEAINLGVARRPDVLVKLVRENGTLVIVGPDAASAAAVVGTDIPDLVGLGGMSLTGLSYVGYNTIGGSTEAMSSTNGKAIHKPISISSPGLLISIGAYVEGSITGLSNARVNLAAWLTADVSGEPGHAIGMAARTANFMAMSTEPRWVDLPIMTKLDPGDYWLSFQGFSSAGNTLSLYYDGSGSDWTLTVAGDSQLDMPPWSATSGTNEYSIRGLIWR